MPRMKFSLTSHKGSVITASLMAFSPGTKLSSSNPFHSYGWRRQIVCFGHTRAMEATPANQDISSWRRKLALSTLFLIHNLKQNYGEEFGLSTSQTRWKFYFGGNTLFLSQKRHQNPNLQSNNFLYPMHRIHNGLQKRPKIFFQGDCPQTPKEACP